MSRAIRSKLGASLPIFGFLFLLGSLLYAAGRLPGAQERAILWFPVSGFKPDASLLDRCSQAQATILVRWSRPADWACQHLDNPKLIGHLSEYSQKTGSADQNLLNVTSMLREPGNFAYQKLGEQQVLLSFRHLQPQQCGRLVAGISDFLSVQLKLESEQLAADPEILAARYESQEKLADREVQLSREVLSPANRASKTMLAFGFAHYASDFSDWARADREQRRLVDMVARARPSWVSIEQVPSPSP